MRRLSVVNHTHEAITCRGVEHTWKAAKQYAVDTTLFPSSVLTFEGSAATVALTLISQSSTEKSMYIDEELSTTPHGSTLGYSITIGTSWKSTNVDEKCPWSIYRVKMSRKHYRLLILPRRDMASFLREMPDSVPLSSLTLPGTHDTMAFYGWPISQCQSLATPLAVQLASGIRLLDIRLAVKDSTLFAYHGPYPQRSSFQNILSVIHAFLTSEKGSEETIVMSIKQEDFMTVPGPIFSELVNKEITEGPGGRNMWFLDNRVPLLGEVRGKVIMFSRFGDGEGWEGGSEGMGIHPTTWPDSEKEGFTWDCKNTVVRTHDWYSIPSFLHIPEKTELAMSNLLPVPDEPPTPVLRISFFSAASFPFAFPPTIARGFGWPKIGFGVEGVNARLARRLMDMLSGEAKNSRFDEPRLRGWALLDFYEDPETALVPLLVEFNFWGRVRGEEGWP